MAKPATEILINCIFHPAYGKARFQSAFVLYFSLVLLGMVPGMRAEVGEYAPGSVLHSLAYSVITFLIYTGMKAQSLRNALGSLILVALMGALDEFIQSFFPYRHGSIDDWIVDVTASSCMLVLLLTLWPSIQRLFQRESDRGT